MYKLYIFWFLHQTTTIANCHLARIRCISFDSYIKPQPHRRWVCCKPVVYLLIPTSNHNSKQKYKTLWKVVYLLIPTSNHNQVLPCIANCQLYIFWFLHQTTTSQSYMTEVDRLYIFWFLHQTTTCSQLTKKCVKLYIFWFLHQTTTPKAGYTSGDSCISFDSYIKPQLTQSLM